MGQTGGSAVASSAAQREAQYLLMRRKLDLLALDGGPAALAAHLDPGGYQRRAHLDVINDTYRDVEAGEVDRVTISLPPQTGKSRTAAVWGAFWWLIKNPTHRIVIASYGVSLAGEHCESVRELVRLYGRRFGLVLKPGKQGQRNWRLTTGGGVRGVGMRGGLTGHPVEGLLIIDDMHKDRQEADSRLIRDRVGNWYSSTAYSRMAPGTAIIMIGTRWHEDDLIGRVTSHEPGRWRSIVMPALCTDAATDPLRREIGAPLPHPRVPAHDQLAQLAHWEDMRTGMSPRDWGALGQCNPKPPEGALISYAVLRARRNFEWDADVHAVKAGVAVDPSGGGRDVAGIIGGALGDDERLHLLADRSGVMQPDQWGRAACELAAEIDADVIYVETNYGGKQATTIVRQAWDALRREEKAQLRELKRRGEKPRFQGLCPRVKAVTARKNKRLRADPVAQAWIEDRIETCVYMPLLEEEWATWQEGADSPGRIDASTYLATGMLPRPRKGRKGQLPGGAIEQVAQHAPKRPQQSVKRPSTARREGVLGAVGYRTGS